MRPDHLEACRPPCPACRAAGRPAPALRLGTVWTRVGDHVTEGLLACPDPACEASWPIVDGIPIVRPDALAYVAAAHALVMRRDDLAPPLAQLLDECAAATTGDDAARQGASTYGWDAWGDLAPDEDVPSPPRSEATKRPSPGAAAPPPDAAPPRPGAARRLLARLDELARARGLRLAADLAPDELILELGPGAGRTCLELAAAGPARVLGLDGTWPLLRILSGVLVHGVARFPVRRSGMVFETRVAPIDHPGRVRADAWCGDAHAVPLPDASVSLVVALNVLDCLRDPVTGLGEIRRVLRPGGTLLLATPFDWSPVATPPAAWIGGHSPLGQGGGDPAALLRDLLAPGRHAQSIEGLELVDAVDDLPWAVRMHDRATMRYRGFGLVARRL